MELFAPSHLLFILLIALLLFGGKKLPELARSIGGSMNELRKGMNEGLGDDKNTTVPEIRTQDRT